MTYSVGIVVNGDLDLKGPWFEGLTFDEAIKIAKREYARERSRLIELSFDPRHIKRIKGVDQPTLARWGGTVCGVYDSVHPWKIEVVMYREDEI